MPGSLRVALTPGAASLEGAREWAARLAGPGGQVVELAAHGVRTLRRRLSQAEVHSMRRALLGLAPGVPLLPRLPEDDLLGLVCAGRRAPGRAPAGPPAAGAGLPGEALAVTDHANLTWRSPLRGPNDEAVGPRFPATAGLYRPGEVLERAGGLPAGVVACIADEDAPSDFENEVISRHRMAAVSTELAPLALVAAHMGFHLAALVLQTGEEG